MKYSTHKSKEIARPYKIHPIWRGFGCIMVILMPIMSGAAAWEMVNGMGKSLKFMAGMNSGYLRLPAIFYTLPGISLLANYLSSIKNFSTLAIFFLLFLIVFTGIMTVVYSMAYRMIGPPRYTQIDAPAPRMTSVKKHKR
jgi:hypothetical protein